MLSTSSDVTDVTCRGRAAIQLDIYQMHDTYNNYLNVYNV